MISSSSSLMWRQCCGVWLRAIARYTVAIQFEILTVIVVTQMTVHWPLYPWILCRWTFTLRLKTEWNEWSSDDKRYRFARIQLMGLETTRYACTIQLFASRLFTACQRPPGRDDVKVGSTVSSHCCTGINWLLACSVSPFVARTTHKRDYISTVQLISRSSSDSSSSSVRSRSESLHA